MQQDTRDHRALVSILASAALLALGSAAFGAKSGPLPGPYAPLDFSAQAKKGAPAKTAARTAPAKRPATRTASARAAAKKPAPVQAGKPPARRPAVAAAKPPAAKPQAARPEAARPPARRAVVPAPGRALLLPGQPVPMPPPRPGGRPDGRAAPTITATVPAATLPTASVPLPPAAPRPPAGTAVSSRMLASALPMLVPPLTAAAAAFLAPTPAPDPVIPALAYAPAAPPPAEEVEVIKEALNLARRGRIDEATERRDEIRDAAGRKLIEWMILRANEAQPSFARFAAFIDANPDWPSIGMLRRRAEARLWQERIDAQTTLRFFADRPPTGALGRLAMVRALLATADYTGAQRYLQDVWRRDSLSAPLEEQVISDFGALLSSYDHKIRLDVRLCGDDFEAAMRTAKRLGEAEVALVQARTAVSRQAPKAGELLDAVPESLHGDPAYLLTRLQWLRRNDRTDEATALALAAPHDPSVIHEPDEWWLERRIMVRRLLDAGRPQEAYRIARDAATPIGREHLRVDQPFTAGWLALRFLNDPRAAARHFAEIAKVTDHPTSLARAEYWLGRAAEAQGHRVEARGHYEAAARHSAAYYGHLAQARLGRREVSVRRPPPLSDSDRLSLRQTQVVRAVELLYATGHRDMVTTFVANLERIGNVGALTLIGEMAAENNDARAMLYLGRDAISRGLAFDTYAFPTTGLPKFASIGPQTDRSLVYSIARQESAFSPRAVSSAKAMGYMQVTPAAGRTIARRYGVKFDAKRLLNDPVYNMQMGAAEIGSLVEEYDGNHVLAFAAYNAGRGRVREWLGRYGDPRDPQVDPVDWVERIPFHETRNYVQRVMEGLQVYRAHFNGSAPLTVEADMRGRRR